MSFLFSLWFHPVVTGFLKRPPKDAQSASPWGQDVPTPWFYALEPRRSSRQLRVSELQAIPPIADDWNRSLDKAWEWPERTERGHWQSANNRDFNPATSVNWILPIAWMNEEVGFSTEPWTSNQPNRLLISTPWCSEWSTPSCRARLPTHTTTKLKMETLLSHCVVICYTVTKTMSRLMRSKI